MLSFHVFSTWMFLTIKPWWSHVSTRAGGNVVCLRLWLQQWVPLWSGWVRLSTTFIWGLRILLLLDWWVAILHLGIRHFKHNISIYNIYLYIYTVFVGIYTKMFILLLTEWHNMDHVDFYQANPGNKNALGVNIERNHGVSSADWFLPSLFRVQFACDLFFCSAAFSVATHCAQQWHRSSTLPSTTMARILPAGHRRCINEDYAWRLVFSWCVC